MEWRSLVPYHFRNPSDPFHLFRREMDRFLEDFWKQNLPQNFLNFPYKGHLLSPEIDVVENNQIIQVKAELPGLTEDDVKIELSDHLLTISGEKRGEKQSQEDCCYISECSHGFFRRVVPLSSSVNKEGIEATMKNGVLKITLPKSSEEGSRLLKINVQKS